MRRQILEIKNTPWHLDPPSGKFLKGCRGNFSHIGFVNVTRKTYAKVFSHHSNKKVTFLGKAAGWQAPSQRSVATDAGHKCLTSRRLSAVPLSWVDQHSLDTVNQFRESSWEGCGENFFQIGFINVTRKPVANVFSHHSNKKVVFLGKAAG